MCRRDTSTHSRHWWSRAPTPVGFQCVSVINLSDTSALLSACPEHTQFKIVVLTFTLMLLESMFPFYRVCTLIIWLNLHIIQGCLEARLRQRCSLHSECVVDSKVHQSSKTLLHWLLISHRLQTRRARVSCTLSQSHLTFLLLHENRASLLFRGQQIKIKIPVPLCSASLRIPDHLIVLSTILFPPHTIDFCPRLRFKFNDLCALRNHKLTFAVNVSMPSQVAETLLLLTTRFNQA